MPRSGVQGRGRPVILEIVPLHRDVRDDDHRLLHGTADASTTFSEIAIGGELRSATATGVYVAQTSGQINPDLPVSQNNTNATSEGSYKVFFTVSNASLVTLTGTLTGNESSTFLQFACGATSDHQSGAGPVDRYVLSARGWLLRDRGGVGGPVVPSAERHDKESEGWI